MDHFLDYPSSYVSQRLLPSSSADSSPPAVYTGTEGTIIQRADHLLDARKQMCMHDTYITHVDRPSKSIYALGQSGVPYNHSNKPRRVSRGCHGIFEDRPVRVSARYIRRRRYYYGYNDPAAVELAYLLRYACVFP